MGINGIEALISDSIVESHDDTDVPAALARETADGSGDLDALPPSDFEEDE